MNKSSATHISTIESLTEALATAVGGEVFSLSEGSYDTVAASMASLTVPVVLIATPTEDFGRAETAPIVAGIALSNGMQLVFDGTDWSAQRDGVVLDLVLHSDGVFSPVQNAVWHSGAQETVSPAAAQGMVLKVAAHESEITVSDQAGLEAALGTATDGTTIRLMAGNYGTLDLEQYDTDVRLLADSAGTAVFDALYLDQVSGVELDGLSFKFTFSEGMSPGARTLRIDNSEDISIRNGVFEGDLAFGTGTVADGNAAGTGLRVSGSQRFVVEDSEFKGFLKGLQIQGSSDVVVRGNELHHMRSDAMTLSQVHNVLVEGNYMHDRVRAEGSKDHADMIQMMSHSATEASTNVTVRGNLFDVGDGDRSQSIFLSNRATANGAGEEMFYRNFLIEDNVIINNQKNAIYLGEIDGLVVRNNSVLHADPEMSRAVFVPVIRVAEASRNVVIEDNVTGGVNGYSGQASWQVSDNIIVQNTDPTEPNHYTEHFVAPTGQLGGHVEKLQLRPDSPIYEQGAGADMMRGNPTPEKLTPLIQSTPQDNRAQYLFDASLSTGADGEEPAPGTQFHWAFSDGSQADGLQVHQQFKEPGVYTATLTVIAPDGEEVVTDSVVEVAGSDLVGLDPETGTLMVWAYGSKEVLYDPEIALENFEVQGLAAFASKQSFASAQLLDKDDLHTDGLDLTLLEDGVALPQSGFLPIFDTGNFEISLTFASGSGTFGTLLRAPGSLSVDITRNGEVLIEMTSEDGQTHKIQTSGASLDVPGIQRDIALTYDLAAGQIAISLDRTIQDSASISAPMAMLGNRSATLGGGDLDGVLSSFFLRSAVENYDFDPSADPLENMLEQLDVLPGSMPVVFAEDLGETLRADSAGTLLVGGDGDDRFREGAGNDVMIGGDGADSFVFDLRRDNGASHDIIADLDFAQGDQLRLITRQDGTFTDISDPENALLITANGAAVSVRSLDDMRELVASGAVQAQASEFGVQVSLEAMPGRVLELAFWDVGDLVA